MLKRIILTAGGTGGHIFPALAIVEEFSTRGTDILFVGNRDSMEEKIVKGKKISFAGIDVQKLYRSLTLKHIKFPYKFIKSCLLSNRIINNYRPEACLGSGGFVSGPVLICSWLRGIPFYLQEQNSVPGLTTKLFSKFARKIFIGFKSAQDFLPKSKCYYTGNPLQKQFKEDFKDINRIDRRNGDHPVSLLILGGSQGAQRINSIILEIIPELLKKKINIIWQTGIRDYQRVGVSLSKKVPGHTIELFPFSSDMLSIYQRTDLALTRAGALSLAELEAMKIPAVIIPLPHSAGNHQYLNAKYQEEMGRAIVIEQKNLNGSILLESIQNLEHNLAKYQDNFGVSEHLSAASSIVNTILEDFEQC